MRIHCSIALENLTRTVPPRPVDEDQKMHLLHASLKGIIRRELAQLQKANTERANKVQNTKVFFGFPAYLKTYTLNYRVK